MYSIFGSGTKNLRPGEPEAGRWLERWDALIEKYPLKILGVILILAMVSSLIVNRDRLPPVPDAGENDTWWAIALNLAHGEGYSLCLTRYFPFCGPSNQATAAREPLPVLLFAGIARLSGDSLWAAVAAELLIYLTILVVIYFLTSQWSGTRPALLAALLWGVYVPAHELVSQVSGDLLAALLVAVGLLFVIRARQIRRNRDWLIAGASLGLAVITRSGTLAIAVVLVAGIMLESWHRRLNLKETFGRALTLSSLVILFMAPWLIRNEVVLGRPILGSSLIGYNLYRHNYMIGSSDYFRHVGGAEALAAIEDLITRRTDLLGDENEAQMDLVYRAEALALIRAHPLQYLMLSSFRFLPLWFNWGYPEAYGRDYDRMDYAIMVLQGALLILVLLSFYRTLCRTWPLWASILAVSFIYMAVDSRLLYLTPVMPLVISLSVGGVVTLRRIGIRG